MRGRGYVAGVVGLVVFTFFITLLGDGRDGFWVNHPMLGALISGGILFAFGALVVQRFVDHRAAQRWSVIARVGYWALGVEVRDTLATLWGVHSDRDDGGGVWLEQGLTPGRELKNDLAGKGAVASLTDAGLPEQDLAPDELVPRQRLRVLMQDQQWLSFALEHILQRNDAARAALREWASLMISAEKPRGLINDFAAYVREVSRVVRALQQLDFALASDDEASAERWTDAALHRWQVADVKGRLMVNDLWAAAGSPYAFAVPGIFHGMRSSEAMRRTGAMGNGWSPAEPDMPDAVT